MVNYQKVLNQTISFLLLALLVLNNACTGDSGNQKPQIFDQELKEKLIEANKSRVAVERSKIDTAIANLGWDLIETGTGLRYQIYSTQNGDSVKENHVVEVNYVITYLNGDTIYTSLAEGSQSFKVGMDNIESGIHEVVTYLKVGDKAHIILPAHLAHGFMGDNQKIPSNTSLVYDLEILSAE